MASLSVDGATAVTESTLTRGQSASSTGTAERAAQQAAARQQIAARVREAAESAERASPEEVQAAAADISEYLSATSRSLNIRFDAELQRPVVTVVDADTEQVVRQIPSEEALAIAKFIRSQRGNTEDQLALAGVILNEQG